MLPPSEIVSVLVCAGLITAQILLACTRVMAGISAEKKCSNWSSKCPRSLSLLLLYSYFMTTSWTILQPQSTVIRFRRQAWDWASDDYMYDGRVSLQKKSFSDHSLKKKYLFLESSRKKHMQSRSPEKEDTRKKLKC